MSRAEEKRLKKAGLSRDGLPLDPNDWSREDWEDLHRTLEAFKGRARRRHDREGNRKGGREPPLP
jgi:hypothetical protein